MPWIAIGSGRHTAYGALHVLADLDLDLEEKARRGWCGLSKVVVAKTAEAWPFSSKASAFFHPLRSI